MKNPKTLTSILHKNKCKNKKFMKINFKNNMMILKFLVFKSNQILLEITNLINHKKKIYFNQIYL
jgi:hypothetical protein